MKRNNYRGKIAKQLSEEINDLEFRLNHPKLADLKNSSMKNIKIGGRLLQAAAPCVLSISLCGYAFSTFGFTPFVSDDVETCAHSRTIVDNVGRKLSEKQYYAYEEEYNALYLYSNWELDKNGSFSRTVKTYFVNERTLDNLVEYLEMDSATIEDALAQPYRIYTETKDNLTEEQIKEKPYVKVIYYDHDTNDVVVRKETIGENVTTTALFIIFSLFGSCTASTLVKKKLPVNLEDAIYNIKEQYNTELSSDDILKKLEIKKDNYERLMRN